MRIRARDLHVIQYTTGWGRAFLGGWLLSQNWYHTVFIHADPCRKGDPLHAPFAEAIVKAVAHSWYLQPLIPALI